MKAKYEFIRLHRKRLGQTQGQYAERYGVTQGLVSAIERGDRYSPREMAVDVVQAFPGDLLLEELNPAYSGLAPADNQDAA